MNGSDPDPTREYVGRNRGIRQGESVAQGPKDPEHVSGFHFGEQPRPLPHPPEEDLDPSPFCGEDGKRPWEQRVVDGWNGEHHELARPGLGCEPGRFEAHQEDVRHDLSNRENRNEGGMGGVRSQWQTPLRCMMRASSPVSP